MAASVGRGARTKGATGERELAHELNTLLPEYTCERGARNGVRGADDVIGLPTTHVEVKRCERIEIEKWCRQSEGDATDGDMPVVVFRRNRQPWRITQRLEDWAGLYRDAMKWRAMDGRIGP